MDPALRDIPRDKWIAAIYLLPDCNMGCTFCGSELGFDVLDPTLARRMLMDLKDRGFTQVVLGGGEPLLWPHGVVDLARAAQELGFLVQLCTNGTLLEGLERETAFDRFILPLEALAPARHDRLRVLPGGHHAQVMVALDRLQSAGRSVSLSTVVTRENLGELPALAEDLARRKREGLAIHAWHLYRFLPMGREGRTHAELATSREAYRAAVDLTRAVDRGFPIYRRSDMLRSSSVAYVWSEGGRLRTA
jgi:MoaA/NifB/PqqE/SkfB family radical SAM enzyme